MMASNARPSKKYLDSTTNMRFSLESKQSSKEQQHSKTAKEIVLSDHEHQSLKYQGKINVKTCVGPAYGNEAPELRREADVKILVQPKSSGNQQGQFVKGKVKKDDELVKHMSNLPGYLRRMQGGENLQDKAFNVGVLDWARLEKWKYNQKCTQASGSNNVSSTSSSLSLKTTIKSSTFSAAAQGGTHAHQSAQHPSLCPSLNPSHKDGLPRGVKPSSQKALHFQDLEISSKSNLGGQKKIPRGSKSFVSSNEDVIPRKGMTKDSDQNITSETGNMSMNLIKHGGVALSLKGKVSGEVKKRIKEKKESSMNRNGLDQKIVSEMDASSPKLKSNGVALSSNEKLSAGYDETKKRTEKSQELNVDVHHQHLPDKNENIVLLLPREFSQNGSVKKFRALSDVNLLQTRQNSLSGCFSLDGVCSEELCSDTSHSRLLPSKDETNKTPTMDSGGEDAEQSTLKHKNANVVENLKILDQEMAETTAMKNRHPSPNRRFSFSLSRLGRSFSLKEGSAVPLLSSTYVPVKSGPVKFEGASFSDDSNREKENGPIRARSSPLRRILDPVLRGKGSNPVHPGETFQPLKGSLNYFNFRPSTCSESLPKEKHEASTIQALVQLTIKNGLPLFKFLVDGNSNVFAATMKNLTSGKDDSGQCYTLYSVNERKKKTGSWISHGSKGRSEYVYNIVGQMKVSNSNSLDLTGQNFKNKYIVRESVFFGVERRQVGQASPKFMPSRELAAVVVKMPTESLSHRTPQRDKDVFGNGLTQCFPRSECSLNSVENENSYSTTVILPGGIHGLPNKGAPSPLIERWKSGGLCDCGGWDVGCKLRIFTNRNESCKTPRTSNYGTSSARFELFAQGEAQQNRPIFSLVPLNKEIYSVEFNSSVSWLQAFFVCVTVLGCRKSFDISGVNSQYDVKSFEEEPTLNGNGRKNVPPNIVWDKVPAKYAPNPPASPVGRV